MIFGLGGSFWLMSKPNIFETYKTYFFVFFDWSNIIKFINFYETNLAQNISPSPKGLMRIISFGGGAIILF